MGRGQHQCVCEAGGRAVLGGLAGAVRLPTYTSLPHSQRVVWALSVPVAGAVASAGGLGTSQGGRGRSDHYCSCLRPTLRQGGAVQPPVCVWVEVLHVCNGHLGVRGEGGHIRSLGK